MTTAPDIPRQIEADPIAQRYARGWHCLGLSKDFRDGKPHQVMAFGTKLVVWADAEGELRVLDAYCRHMGGDLSQGTVKDGNIACPFHDWRWGGDGRCKQIPYSRRVPLRARTSAWPTLDQDGMLFVWNDPEGNPPIAEQAIPRIPGATSDEWTDWHWYSIKIDGSNCREIVDNVVDMAHFFYVHYSMPTYFKNIFEGHVATQVMNGTDRGDIVVPSEDGATLLGMTSTASYFGPSFMIDDLVYQYDTGDFESILINCHYPVDTNSFVLQYGIIVKKPQGVSDEQALASAVNMGDFIKTGFEQDVDLAEQGPHRQPPAVRGGRPGLPAAPVVPAVLHRRRRRPAGDDRAVRVRARHDPAGRGVVAGGRGQYRPCGRERVGLMGAPVTVRPDVRLESAPMSPVSCETCGAAVEARKSSWEQTSIQWHAADTERCLERRAAMPPRIEGTLFTGCASLRQALSRAVERGDLPVLTD